MYFGTQVLSTKLFVVMGISWIFECFHYLLHSDHTHTSEHCYDSVELILRIIGCLNLLRGSLIFFIFVCKDSILDKVSTLYLFNQQPGVDQTLTWPLIILHNLGLQIDRVRSKIDFSQDSQEETHLAL